VLPGLVSALILCWKAIIEAGKWRGYLHVTRHRYTTILPAESHFVGTGSKRRYGIPKDDYVFPGLSLVKRRLGVIAVKDDNICLLLGCVTFHWLPNVGSGE
jgi:hypothetical protein